MSHIEVGAGNVLVPYVHNFSQLQDVGQKEFLQATTTLGLQIHEPVFFMASSFNTFAGEVSCPYGQCNAPQSLAFKG
jgi:hypothetical protein